MSIDYLSYETKQPQFFESQYQINTSKVVKGNKLTMKNMINKLQIKIRKPDLKKTIKNREKQIQTLIPKFTEYFQKYKGLQCIQDQESLHKFIEYQREKHSRESTRNLKLFNCQKSINQILPYDTIDNNFLELTDRKNKTADPLRRRQSYQDKSKNTISYSIKNSKTLKRNDQTTKVSFNSQNLGKRMNQYLNLVIKKKQKDSIDIKQTQIAQELQIYKAKLQLQNQQKISKNSNRMKINSYYRQMKRNIKSRGSQYRKDNNIAQESILIKGLARKTANNFYPNSHRTTIKSWKHQQKNDLTNDLKNLKQLQTNNNPDLLLSTINYATSRHLSQHRLQGQQKVHVHRSAMSKR